MIHPSLLSAGLVQLSCQFFKFIYYSLNEKKMSWKYLVTAGGMPSSHSAFVSALTVSLAIWEGLDSAYFALSFVFSAIVIFDSLRLRYQVQLLSIKVNQLTSDKPLATMVGHNMAEVVVGVVLGVVGGVVFSLLVTNLEVVSQA